MDEHRRPKARSAQRKPHAASLPVARTIKDNPKRSTKPKPASRSSEPFRAPFPTDGRHSSGRSRVVWVIGAVGGCLLVVAILVIANLFSGDDVGADSDAPTPMSAKTPRNVSSETQGDSRKTAGERIDTTGRHAPLKTNASKTIAGSNDVNDADSDGAVNPDSRLGRRSIPSLPTRPFPDYGQASTDAFATIHRSLSRRDMAGARQQLDQLEKSTDDVERSSRIARLRIVYQHIARFWALVITKARQTSPTTLLRYADSQFVVTSVDPTAISVRQDQTDARYRFDNAVREMPTELVMALYSATRFDGDPNTALYAGVFLAIDENGSLACARMLCAQAARHGVDCEAILPELDLENIDALAAIETRELSTRFAITGPVVSNPTPTSTRSADGRLPVPSSESQATSFAKVRAVFKSEYARAKSTEAKRVLAAKLFDQAKSTQSDTVARWVLLAESRRLSVTAGDVPLLMSVVTMQAEQYHVDRLKEAFDALRQLSSKAEPLRSRSAPQRIAAVNSIVKQMLATADDAIVADEYEIASQLSKMAGTLARNIKDNALSRIASACQKNASELEKQWQIAGKARQKLEKNPTDPQANSLLGRYLCLIKGDWEEGLPLLAQGSSKGYSAAFRRVAVADLTNPSQMDRQIKLAEAWWKLAKATQSREQSQLARRAQSWYLKAHEKAVDLDKVQIGNRLKEIDVLLARADADKNRSGGKQFIVPFGSGVTMRFQLIPRGKLAADTRMKSTTIDRPFFIGVTEVTQAQWQTVMGNNPSRSKTSSRLPVESVSWDDCQQFINKLNAMGKGKYRFRLPTESEWEYACRAGTTSTFYFGNDPSLLPQYAWFSNNASTAPRQVATLKPNPAGLYDITGNVWEWCQGAIIRGGCYHRPADQCTWKSRNDYSTKKNANPAIGLRIVIDP